MNLLRREYISVRDEDNHAPARLLGLSPDH